MKSKKATLIRGRRVRATKIDPAGRVVFGDSQSVVTQGLISIGYTTNTEEGEAINVPNFAGIACVVDPATPSFNGYSVEIEFCEVDFALFNLLTGQKLVYNPDNGEVVGLRESTDIDLTAVNFALELWTGANSNTPASVGSEGLYGYILTPFLSGGVIGDLTIENDAITFTVSNMSTRNGNSWGRGPYAVELVDGVPSVLSTPLEANEHRGIQTVEVAPPAIYGGSIPVLDPSDPALTGVTTTVAAGTLDVTFAPAPAGSEPVFYDFGDGEFDYAETGTYVHTYADAGTYTFVAKRGVSTFTGTVTVA